MIEVPPTTLFAQSYSDDDALISSSRKRKRQSHIDGLQRTPFHTITNASTPDRDGIPTIRLGDDGHSPATQSATALFRSPSASSKKYTRPPMSKLFTSLELGPENFLHLQAAAKAYMLDPDHPERGDCVGQRGKGDSELVKVRLWNCAAYFLDKEGHGQAHFGEPVLGDEGQTRSMIWPRDRSRIIGAVIPLLRRMVTNERQRQYAVETRKGGNAGNARNQESGSTPHSPTHHYGDPGMEQPDMGNLYTNDPLQAPGDHGRLTPSTHSPVGILHQTNSIRLHVSILRDRRRIRPSYEVLAGKCPNLQAIYAQATQQYGDTDLASATVSVLLPQGLTRVYSDEQWVKALSTVQETEWMDGETKVVIDRIGNEGTVTTTVT